MGLRDNLDPTSKKALERMMLRPDIDADKGVASVLKTWQFVGQLTDEMDHADMATRLRDFFAAEAKKETK